MKLKDFSVHKRLATAVEMFSVPSVSEYFKKIAVERFRAFSEWHFYGICHRGAMYRGRDSEFEFPFLISPAEMLDMSDMYNLVYPSASILHNTRFGELTIRQMSEVSVLAMSDLSVVSYAETIAENEFCDAYSYKFFSLDGDGMNFLVYNKDEEGSFSRELFFIDYNKSISLINNKKI